MYVNIDTKEIRPGDSETVADIRTWMSYSGVFPMIDADTCDSDGWAYVGHLEHGVLVCCANPDHEGDTQ